MCKKQYQFGRMTGQIRRSMGLRLPEYGAYAVREGLPKALYYRGLEDGHKCRTLRVAELNELIRQRNEMFPPLVKSNIKTEAA